MDVYDYYITDEEIAEAEKNGISEQTLISRVRLYGWSKSKAIGTPTKKRVDKKYRDVAKRNGISEYTFYARVRNGWSLEKASTEPVEKNKVRCMNKAREVRNVYPTKYVKMAESNGIPYKTFQARVTVLKWDIEKAATKPVMTSREIGIKNKSKRNKFIFGRGIKAKV